MSRRLLALCLVTGCVLAGPPGCGGSPPAKSASLSGRVAQTRHGTSRQRSAPDAESPGLARSSETAPEASPPPEDEASLEARYGSRRALSVLTGEASYYGDSLAGHRTANGERYDPGAFTAAHRTLPFGTVLRVVRVDTGAVVYVRVTDRGPFGHASRILDLSRAAADRLHMLRRGVARVRAEIVEYGRAPVRRRRSHRR